METDKTEKEAPAPSESQPSPTTESSKSTDASSRLAAERLAAWRREGQLFNPLKRVENIYERNLRMDQSQNPRDTLAEIKDTIETITSCHLVNRANLGSRLLGQDAENDKNEAENDDTEGEDEDDFILTRELTKRRSTFRWRTDRAVGEQDRKDGNGGANGISVDGKDEEEEEDEKTKKERKKYFSVAAMAERAAKYNQSQRRETSKRVYDWVVHHANNVALNQLPHEC